MKTDLVCRDGRGLGRPSTRLPDRLRRVGGPSVSGVAGGWRSWQGTRGFDELTAVRTSSATTFTVLEIWHAQSLPRRWASRPPSGYRGAQIFEAIGIGQELIDRCFTGTPIAARRHWSGRDWRGRDPAARAKRSPMRPPNCPIPDSFASARMAKRTALQPDVAKALQRPPRPTSDPISTPISEMMQGASADRPCAT